MYSQLCSFGDSFYVLYYTCIQLMFSIPYERSISSLGTTRHTIQMFFMFICLFIYSIHQSTYFVLVYVHLYVWL